jgi:hypothetical protein
MEKKENYKSSIINKRYSHFSNNCFLNSSFQVLTKPIYYYKYLIDHLLITTESLSGRERGREKKSLDELIKLITQVEKKPIIEDLTQQKLEGSEQATFLTRWREESGETIVTGDFGQCSDIVHNIIKKFEEFRYLFQTRQEKKLECPKCFNFIKTRNAYGLSITEMGSTINAFFFGHRESDRKKYFQTTLNEVIDFYFENFDKCKNCKTHIKIENVILPKFLYIEIDQQTELDVSSTGQIEDTLNIHGVKYSICDVVFRLNKIHFVTFSKRQNNEWWYFNDWSPTNIDNQALNIAKRNVAISGENGTIVDDFKKKLESLGSVQITLIMYEKD